MADAETKADGIIAGGVTAAMAGAVIPIPVADTVAITSAQVAMLGALSAVYGVALDQRTIYGLVLVYGGAKAGEFLGSMLKFIPGLGTVVGGALQMAIAGTVTAAMGIGMKNMLKKGETVNAENLKRHAQEAKSEAKSLAKQYEGAAKEKARRDAVIRERVALTVRASSGEITASFNLDGLPTGTLRLVDDQGRELLSQPAGAADSPVSLRSARVSAGNEYIVTLDVSGTTVAASVRP